MKLSGMAYGRSTFSEIACLNSIQKIGPSSAYGTGIKKKVPWSSFLIRNDFGPVFEKHETIEKLPLFVRML